MKKNAVMFRADGDSFPAALAILDKYLPAVSRPGGPSRLDVDDDVRRVTMKLSGCAKNTVKQLLSEACGAYVAAIQLLVMPNTPDALTFNIADEGDQDVQATIQDLDGEMWIELSIGRYGETLAAMFGELTGYVTDVRVMTQVKWERVSLAQAVAYAADSSS